LASQNEPILLSGPSSYKTYIAEKFLSNNNRTNKYKIISLNSELTTAQLIGTPILLTTEKAQNYYLRQICEILQVNNLEKILKEFEELNSNKELIKEKITKLKEDFMKNNGITNMENYPFNYALERFIEKLTQDEKEKKSKFGFDIEFKPGIFISALIKGCNLILKNITNVKTENLERLNEAFTGNKKITLN